MQGIALPLYPDRSEGATARRRRRLAEIADTGANSVAIVVTWAQRDVAATAIRKTDETVADRVVTRAIRTARPEP